MSVEFIARTMPGQRACGDAAVVRREEDWSLLSVVDGLGHGEKAHRAAEAATEALHQVTAGESIDSIMHRLDSALRGTRGAAATVCTVRGRELEGCGVGNVEVRSRHTSIPWVLTPGILGRGLRKPRFFDGTLEDGARVVLFSDGISGRFSLSDMDALTARELCETLVTGQGRDNDDATVMVVDIGG